MSDFDPGEARHQCCPSCGSKKHKFAKTTYPAADEGVGAKIPIKDRICKKCGTTYHAALPKITAWVFIALGPMAFFVILLDLNGELFTNGWSLTWIGRIAFAGGGIYAMYLGIRLLLDKPHLKG